eukprot:TRINITY_DN2396_c0_g1_i3.p1 TRINITY_DN2396_c0_g1~~TRINITY_DN2396_c0_g1_i3.p1  ORF type:complete len:318 (-),score=65.12 TRINITY_DN2396_c0_g1_i3:606-1559(-)
MTELAVLLLVGFVLAIIGFLSNTQRHSNTKEGRKFGKQRHSSHTQLKLETNHSIQNPVICKYFAKGECTRINCQSSHSKLKVDDKTEVTTQKVTDTTKPLPFQKPAAPDEGLKPVDKKKDKICMFWLSNGYCKLQNSCLYQHPPPKPQKPTLGDILIHQSSTRQYPNKSYTLPLTSAGLHPLPTNGKREVTANAGYVIDFIPYFKPISGIIYYKSLLLFRFIEKKNTYKLIFKYSKKDFHFTTASASNGYFVCSRLPYEPDVLRMMEENRKLRDQKEKLQSVMSSIVSSRTKTHESKTVNFVSNSFSAPQIPSKPNP